MLQFFTLLGALGMFLYGMNLMSSGLQKAAGNGLRKLLASITSNPIKGVLTGLGITSIIQSSSATTVMVVGFVNAGLLTLAQAIGVIMGANIGTTVTAWIVSIFGFKFDIATLAVPLMAVGFLLSLSKKGRTRDIGEFVIGFSLLFLGLAFMKNSVPDLNQNPEIFAFIKDWSGHGFGSVLLFLLFGTVLTLILQSSSATVALTMVMLSMGWIEFPMAAAMVLGENIGTTITANIAAAVGNTMARRAALAHTVFNVFGVCWALLFFKLFLGLIAWIVSSLGLDSDPSQTTLYQLSMLHTVFNIINTCILIWFIPVIEKIVCTIIKDKPEKDSDKDLRLKYINAGLVSTPELAVTEASNEVVRFAELMKKGLGYVKDAVNKSDKSDDFEFLRKKLVRYEEVSDSIEGQVVNFLNNLDKGAMSGKSVGQTRSMLRIVGELESLGDSGEAISRILTRKNEHDIKLLPDHISSLNNMITLVDNAYDAMIFNLKHPDEIISIDNAIKAEVAINTERDACREKEYSNIENKGEAYFEGVFYLDILDELEKMGDYMINVSQAILAA